MKNKDIIIGILYSNLTNIKINARNTVIIADSLILNRHLLISSLQYFERIIPAGIADKSKIAYNR